MLPPCPDHHRPTNPPGHPIADAHPENLDTIIFPGQDYNNARVYDFEDVDKWENNKREPPSLVSLSSGFC